MADLQYTMIHARPYELTSDDVLFEVMATRKEIPESARATARDELFARLQACLRASPLVKQFGWGVHHDDQERIAPVAVDSDEYQRLNESPDVKKVAAMRSKRA